MPKHVIESALTKTAVGLGNVDNTSDVNKPVSTAQQTALDGKSNVGHGHSFAEISGQVSSAQLPPLAVNDTFVVATQVAMLALTAQRGDIAIRTDVSKTFVLSTDNPATLADWKEITAAGAVISVAGRAGAVTLAKADVGLGSVDNTSDASKPVSTAQQTALNAKENTITAGTTSQFFRGDKTFVALTKTDVGLGSVDNTSDASKPVSTAQATAIGAKADKVGAADIEITDATKGYIMKAPGGLRYRLTVGDDGALTTTTVP